MQKTFGTILISFFFLMWSLNLAYAQFTIQSNSYLEYAYDQEREEQYFEDWTDLYVLYQNWRAGIRYEIHRPPFPFSQDHESKNDLTQRFVEYRNSFMGITVGNFYTLLGRGLVLRSFENRILRWDNNIDGGKFEFYQRYVDLQILGGKPRDLQEHRKKTLFGGAANIKPFSIVRFGGTYLRTKLEEEGEVYWGSAFTGFNFNWGNFYFERAFKEFSDEAPEGKAYYFSGNVYVSSLTALLEYRKYQRYALEEGSLSYNNPPSVVREHLYTLLNRNQLVQDAGDEEGYMIEVSYSLDDYGVLTLNHSRTEDSTNALIYREYYGQFEFDPFENLNLVMGGGEQRDVAHRYLNFVGTGKWDFAGYHGIKAIFEHQHVKVLLNDRQFYNQALALSYESGGRFTLSLLSERTTDQFSKKDYWIGGQLDVQLPFHIDLTVFGGSRRKGKICAGGICIERPAFEGIEVRMIHRF
ncbi:MAG: hypothetical protein Kow0042_10950 [Calditrichia bacterium]